MCLIIHRDIKMDATTPHLELDLLRSNNRQNPDGFGAAWRQANNLFYQKFGPKQFDSFHDLVYKLDADPTIEYTAHLRNATHGPISTEFSHPFVYKDANEGDVLVFHNGIINISCDDKKESDTSAFVNRVMAKLESGWWRNPVLKYLVEATIEWSKILIMTRQETVYLNEHRWKKIDGISYSTDPHPYTWSGKGGASIYEFGSYPFGISPKGEEKNKDDDKEEEAVISADRALILPHEYDWVDSGGHYISRLNVEDKDPDYESGSCVCETCNTFGHYYDVGGTMFYDLQHDIHAIEESVDNI